MKNNIRLQVMEIAKWSVAIIVVTTLIVIGFWAASDSFMQQKMKEQIIASGRFHQVAHKGEGTATLYKMLNGDRVLQLSDFKTGEGQGLEVYLISAPDAFENETVEKSETISLGALQHTEGNQSYTLPRDVDLQKCGAVAIWSTRYGVNFTTAPLKATNRETMAH
jgi:hypothetical protein